MEKTMINKTLKEYFGYDRFREGQEAVISAVVNGESSGLSSLQVRGNHYATNCRHCT
jgi:superfamily II DNA helicase RecQ